MLERAWVGLHGRICLKWVGGFLRGKGMVRKSVGGATGEKLDCSGLVGLLGGMAVVRKGVVGASGEKLIVVGWWVC